ncbi:DUF1285 domain-containing protein [Novosphingobium rosa]|uniref:DUF1285 domain-containing protein n=1 Tax=Novosphingobium rosa TaxID=76978 RepID=UPI0008353F6C|nr:DUF1285 domain-containing protein [Novosphingobium rosa]
MTNLPEAINGLTLNDIAKLAEEGKLPPVESWNPPHCGDSAMRILPDGTWLHEGSPITRPRMVRLFSTVLRREEDGSHVLVTPVEKLSIAVEDAPFVAVEMKSEGEGRDRRLAFRTNVGDLVVAGPDHRLSLEDRGHGARLYLHVRKGLDALIGRAPYYELANLALEEPASPDGPTDGPTDGTVGLWSEGCFFPLGSAS